MSHPARGALDERPCFAVNSRPTAPLGFSSWCRWRSEEGRLRDRPGGGRRVGLL